MPVCYSAGQQEAVNNNVAQRGGVFFPALTPEQGFIYCVFMLHQISYLLPHNTVVKVLIPYSKEGKTPIYKQCAVIRIAEHIQKCVTR